MSNITVFCHLEENGIFCWGDFPVGDGAANSVMSSARIRYYGLGSYGSAGRRCKCSAHHNNLRVKMIYLDHVNTASLYALFEHVGSVFEG